MSSTTSYNNDKVVTGEVEYPTTDPASGAFFHTDFKKNEDLKVMLDGSKDSLKLEAMKRIIGMIAKGRDASDLFPAVVKNVVSKNIEVKKLVYVYLVRYAEEQQDLALLSISTFQRALKDPNQLIRASALRVLSSIRVPMIVPIVMLAIRDSASDMSPYVRKTAAHAIPKLYSLDPEQKEELVQVIDRLLSDKAPLVVGSAAMAFSEVCPDRMSLIHRSYRKLCALLADVDEWGQLTLLNMLTVYARTCFPDPNNEALYSSDSESNPSDAEAAGAAGAAGARRGAASLEPDHRLLLRAVKPLLQSRNAGVVLAVAQLFCHAAPVQEMPPVAKALVRLLRAPVEVQSVVLTCVAALTVTRPALFQPFLKSFFVRNSDPTHIKLLKLEIVSNIANESNAGVVLRELQTYVSGSDSKFCAATVHAVGRLATHVHTHTQPCLTQLLKLLSSKDERVVCEAVVVVKRVVGGGAAPAAAAVQRASRLLHADRLRGAARAAALWLVAEHGASQPPAAAALAHITRTFADQEELVKLQTLSLAVKLSVRQPATLPLCRHVAALARYDASYDVRDRARALRRFLEPAPAPRLLHRYTREIFCPEKPQPIYTSSFKDRSQYTVGSLSQYIGAAAAGYRPLPAPPAAPLPAALRDAPAADDAPAHRATAEHHKNKSFYSEPDSSGSESSSSDDSSSEESDEDDHQDIKIEKKEAASNGRSSKSSSEDSSADSSSSSEESSDDSSEHSEHDTNNTTANDNKAASNLELLLELDAAATALPTMTPTCGGLLSPPGPPHTHAGLDDDISPTGAALVPARALELVPRVLARGLRLTAAWTRAPHLYCRAMCAVDLTFTNHSSDDVTDIRIENKIVSGSRSLHEFAPISVLAAGAGRSVLLGVDFADSIQPVEFTVTSSLGSVSATLTPPVGELMRAVTMSPPRWDQEQRRLRGMTECEKKSSKLENEQAICRRVFETANLAAITATGDLLRFAGTMMSSQDLVLLAVKIEEDATRVVANCPNMAIASMLANEVAQALARG